MTMKSDSFSVPKKGRVLILGGSGYLGSNVAKRALLEGYQVTSLSRRGSDNVRSENVSPEVDYRAGDARDSAVLDSILSEGQYVAVLHCIGLLFDANSRLSRFNRFVSGSGSIPDRDATYDDITRITAMNAIEATEKYAEREILDGDKKIPFIFTSAAEANWPNVRGGKFVEKNLTPNWMKRYVAAKRAVEDRLLNNSSSRIRPVIFRPALIYSLEKVPSLPAVLALNIGNRAGLKFVDRPVTVQSLAIAMINAIGDASIEGPLGFREIDLLTR